MTDEAITTLKIGGLRIMQARSGYRFSLDPVLLCDFVELPARARVADLGTGSGIIPLLLHHHGKGNRFCGIERQPGLADRARRSIALNGLQGQIEIIHGDLRKLPPAWSGGFDAVIANPPYRKPISGRIAPDEERAAARHELAGGLADFLTAAKSLLRSGGKVFLVYLAERMVELLTDMQRLGLEPKRLRMVHPRAGEAANLVLVEGRQGSRAGCRVEPPLIIYAGPGRDYTPEIRSIYENEGD